GLWPGVAQACGALANPQIRAVATIAGNLMQGPRCWYYRHPDYRCLRKGGDTCYAREGEHPWHVCFDSSPCAAPHASTVAMALAAYDAEVELVAAPGAAPRRMPVLDALATDDPGPGGLITAVFLPAPWALERSAYVRASNRSRAEWALVEVSVRLVLDDDDRITAAAVAAGAVAPKPLRLQAVEQALVGQRARPKTLADAAALASRGAKPLAQTAYKPGLLEGTVLTALERALTAPITPTSITIDPAGATP
ncbi:MAG: FAD binding domain-containing protein, partial [Myxococcales bacterium]|nr:FAD binding domain-containing protein [Myxococcales bacterium]